MRLKIGLLIFIVCVSVFAERNLLDPVKTDTPRETMDTYLEAMKAYKRGKENQNDKLSLQIDRAARTLDLKDAPSLLRREMGREIAILLKEVIDRIIVIDLKKIPDNKELPRWRLKDTDITIAKIAEGPRKGEYLFSRDTVARARTFYEAIKDAPYLPGSGDGALYAPPWIDKVIPVWANRQLFGLYLWQWVGILVSIFLGLIVKVLAQFLLRFGKRFIKMVSRFDDKLIDLAEKPLGLLAACIFWLICLHSLGLSGVPFAMLRIILQLLTSFSLIWLCYRLSEVLSESVTGWVRKSQFDLDDQLVPLIARALRLFVLVFGILVAAQNLGLNVASILAGLGLGGLAFALAAKDTAANIFGTLMILSDSPFRIGDWIVAGGVEGTVEEIGFRSTRIRTFYNSQLSVPNSVLATQGIDNMGRRQYRRVSTTLGVTYDTTPEKMEAFLEGIKNIIRANPTTRKDYFHVVFSAYGASSLDIMLYFFLKVSNWSEELVERQNIYIEILRLAHQLNVNFAFPSQSLYVESTPEHPKSTSPSEPAPQLKELARSFGPKGKHSNPAGLGIFTPPYREST